MSETGEDKQSAKTETNAAVNKLQSIISNLERYQLSQNQSTNPLTALFLENIALKLESRSKDDELDKCKKEIERLKIILKGIHALKSETEQLKTENEKLKEEDAELLLLGKAQEERISRSENDNQKLSDRSVIADGINKLYELFILEFKDEDLFKPLVKEKTSDGKTWYEVDLKMFKNHINAEDIEYSQKKPYFDKLEIFTKNMLNYEKIISAIYKHIGRNEDDQVHPLPNI